MSANLVLSIASASILPLVTLRSAIFAVVTAPSTILDVVKISSAMSNVCIRLGSCSSCALYKSCVVLLFKSAAFTDDPAVNVALAVSTLVSRYMRMLAGLDGILPDVKTTLPPPVVV